MDVTDTEVKNLTTGRRYPITQLPLARRAIMEAGGLIAYTRKRLLSST
jgi:hypothetical protein